MADAAHKLLASFFHPSESPLGAALEQAHAAWQSIPYTAILVGHCLYCTTFAPDTRQHFLLNYWLTFLAGFAGGPLSALLIMVGAAGTDFCVRSRSRVRSTHAHARTSPAGGDGSQVRRRRRRLR